MVVSHGGDLFRPRPVPGTSPFPELLSATGLFEQLAPPRVAPWLVAYEINAAAWADGAEVLRWLAPNGRATVAPGGAIQLAPGSVVVQHFQVPAAAEGRPRPIETRVLVRAEADWIAATYLWDESGTDAARIAVGIELELPFPDPLAAGAVRLQRYQVPGPSACGACHAPGAAATPGLHAVQLSRPVVHAGNTTDQLAAWHRRGLLAALPEPPPVALPDPRGTAGTAADRARAWLHVHCAHCHRGSAASLDLRFGVADTATHAIGVAPRHGGLGLAEPAIIAPGDRHRSVLWHRISTPGPLRMPPLGTLSVDEAGAELVGSWIDAMPAPR